MGWVRFVAVGVLCGVLGGCAEPDKPAPETDPSTVPTAPTVPTTATDSEPCPDSDGDGVCDSDDACPGFDDTQDGDGDGTADGCDACPSDPLDDSDGDGVCDSDDACPGFDDTLDGDSDGTADGCDRCPSDPLDDSDGDGSCDSDDACPGSDDTLDGDADGIPDGCDACLLGDDALDTDVDGEADACDACPLDALGDSDGDGVCDSDDRCAGEDDGRDVDGDGDPDGCDCWPYVDFDPSAASAITVPSAPAFDLGSGDFTIEFAARFGSACDWGVEPCTAIAHTDGPGGTEAWSVAWQPNLGAGGGLVWQTESAVGGTVSSFVYEDVSLLNGWHVYAVVRTAAVLELYVDGAVVASEPISGAVPFPSGDLALGSREGAAVLDGGLRQVRISNVARYAGSATPSLPFVADADTVALWALDEGTGLVAGDASGGGHTGTLVGASWARGCDVASGPPPATRTVLTYDDLVFGPEQAAPVDDTAGFQIPPGALLPDHQFEGRLELLNEDTLGNFVKVKDDYNYDIDAERLHLPEFEHSFVQDGHDLIPVERGNINTTHPYWTTLLEPGKVWKEAGDNGLSRASIPFAIVQRNSNCTHNGLLTFLFDDTSVSQAHYQITQETCAYFQGDFWGLLGANYLPEVVPDATQIRLDHQAELAARVPTRPIAELAVDYPGTDLTALTSGLTPINLTRYGFVYNGVSYVSDCETRTGWYPYCEAMRMPSYSLAKSMFAGTVRMAIDQTYGTDVGAEFVDPLVFEASQGLGDYTDVTVDHALDMTTGHYKFVTYLVDEGGLAMTNDFFLAETLADKSAGAFDWQRKTNPGTNWVYRTSDTFIATRAMSEFLQTLVATPTDIFDFLVDTVWVPLEVGPGAHTTLRTSDNNWQGEPFGGYGLWLIADDIAKITTLLNVDEGQIDGVQVLEPTQLAAAMQRDPLDRGMLTTSPVPFQYNNGFWALEFTTADGYGCDFWVPFMSGYGGITVAMMPSGATFWYVSDNSEYDWQDVVAESHWNIADNCVP